MLTFSSISLERSSAWVTWLIVSGFSLLVMAQTDRFSLTYLLVTTLLYIAYFVLWTFISADSEVSERHVDTKRIIAMVTLYFVIVAIYFAVPITFVAIFMVIYSAITPYFMSIRRAAMISPFLALPLFLVYHFYWHIEGAFMTAILFWTFNIFSLVMVNTSIRERDARLEAEMTSRKLEATQSLLNEAVKQSERVRIARNIHDLLGHHLTALTINLQVASRKSEGEVKDSIDQCHQLAKLLLSDVREAVSDIREKSTLDIKTSIKSMVDKLPQLQVEITIDEHMHIDDIQIADAILKTIQESITNTLKHAKGSRIIIHIHHELRESSNNKQICVNIKSDGNQPKEIKQGNGLHGIKERLCAINGTANFMIKDNSFNTQLTIPVNQND